MPGSYNVLTLEGDSNFGFGIEQRRFTAAYVTAQHPQPDQHPFLEYCETHSDFEISGEQLDQLKAECDSAGRIILAHPLLNEYIWPADMTALDHEVTAPQVAIYLAATIKFCEKAIREGKHIWWEYKDQTGAPNLRVHRELFRTMRYILYPADAKTVMDYTWAYASSTPPQDGCPKPLEQLFA